MGCVVGKSTVETVLSELSENRSKIADYKRSLAKPENSEMLTELVQMPELSEEIQKSLGNFLCLAKHFPSENQHSEEIHKKLSTFSSRNSNDQAYIVLKLQESDLEKKICDNFIDQMEKLKKLDREMGQKITSKAVSIEKIIAQGNLKNLAADLENVKEKQITLSSFRGGSFEETAIRVNERFELDRELEVIQTKLEAQQYLDMLASTEGDCKELYQEITDLRNEKNDLERAWDMVRINTKSNDAEIEQLKEALLKQQPIVDKAQTEVDNLKQAKLDFETKMIEIVALQEKVNDVDLEILGKEKLLQNYRDKKKYSQGQSEEASRLNEEILKKTTEKEALSAILEKLENKLENLQKAPEIVPEDLMKLDTEVNNLSEKSLSQSEEIAKSIESHNKALRTSITIRLKNAISANLEISFSIWKWVKDFPVEEQNLSMVINDFPMSGVEIDDEEEEKKNLVLNNDIMLKYGKSKEKPISVINLFKFLEGLMDNKYETDLKDLKENRMPRTMTEYIQEHLSRLFGIPKIANRQLAQIIPALKLLFDEKDPYGSLYCRLFQLFDNEPIHLNFAIFLTRSRFFFQQLIEKQEKSGAANVKNNRVSRGKELIEEAKAGGYAFATDVIDLISNMYKDSRSDGIIAVRMLKPDDISMEDYIFFEICHKFVKTGKNVEALFNIIDKDSSLSIDRKELSQFTRNSIDLWVDETDLDYCFSKIFSTSTKEIPKEVFKSIFNMKLFNDLSKSKTYLISKAKFMSVLEEMYKTFKERERGALLECLKPFPEALTKEQFCELLMKISPEADFSYERYFYEVSQGDRVSHTSFMKVIHKHGLGGYRNSPYATPELYERLEEKKVKTLLDESILSSDKSRDRSKTAYK